MAAVVVMLLLQLPKFKFRHLEQQLEQMQQRVQRVQQPQQLIHPHHQAQKRKKR